MSGFNPQRHGMVADISLELFIVHVGDSAVTTVTIESYTLFPSPQFALVLLQCSHYSGPNGVDNWFYCGGYFYKGAWLTPSNFNRNPLTKVQSRVN